MTTPQIVTRAQWGALPWRTPPQHVSIQARDYFFNHYHGGPPKHDRGVAMAKEVEAIHRNQGWIGVGYGLMVGQDGVAYEGRGWELIGAHCPNFNTRGMSVYYAVGGTQKLSDAAKATGRWLRDEHIRRRGKGVLTTFHGAHYPTACCGASTIAWVKLGMPAAAMTGSASSFPNLPSTTPPKRGALELNGQLSRPVFLALQTRLTAAGMKPGAIDGDFGPNSTKALQRYLNAKLGGADLVVDGDGFAQDGRKYKTVAALQRWLATPVDGILSKPKSAAVVRLQDRLNRHNF